MRKVSAGVAAALIMVIIVSWAGIVLHLFQNDSPGLALSVLFAPIVFALWAILAGLLLLLDPDA